MKGHRQCSTPGCANIVSKKEKKKNPQCKPCRAKLEAGPTQEQPIKEAPSLADRLADLEKHVKG